MYRTQKKIPKKKNVSIFSVKTRRTRLENMLEKNGFLVNVMLYIIDVKMVCFTSSHDTITAVTGHLFYVHSHEYVMITTFNTVRWSWTYSCLVITEI